MLEKLARAVTRRPKLVVILALALLIPSVIGYVSTRVNYDVLSYIPHDLDSMKGEAILEEPFKMAATAMLIVEDMPADYAAQLQKKIEDVPGVNRVLSEAGLLGANLPLSMLPEELKNLFYAEDPTRNSTMMMIFFDSPAASGETMDAIAEIREISSQQCFLAGFSSMITEMQTYVGEEMPVYILVAVVLALVAMTVMMESWLLPFAILLNIGLAIVYNMGSNVFFGEISFVTQALAAILQLGVTMDYSVFLYNRYREEIPNYADKRDAMAKAIEGAFISLAGSSLTTIAGFAALCVMQISLGLDVGLVMMKGVLLGILCVVFILPGILLVLDTPIEKFKHRAFNPSFTPMNRFIVKHRKALFILGLVAAVPAIYSQQATVPYRDLVGNMLPSDAPSVVATDKLKSDYGIVNQHFVVMHSDTLTTAELNDMIDRIEAVEGVKDVLTFRSFVPKSVPDFFLPSDILEMFQQEGWTYIMVNSSYETATGVMEEQINEINGIIKSFDADSYLTGAAIMAKDFYETADVDFARTSFLSIVAILLIVLCVFRSVSIPVLLVACIELAIYINEGIPYWMGVSPPFIANTFIGCIQLGATVDYSILIATRFREELHLGYEPKEAMIRAADASDHSILTGGLVLFSACLSVSLISHLGLVASLCAMLARGTLISMAICMFLVPAVLVIFEPLIAKTSIGWRKKQPAKAESQEEAVCVKNG